LECGREAAAFHLDGKKAASLLLWAAGEKAVAGATALQGAFGTSIFREGDNHV